MRIESDHLLEVGFKNAECDFHGHGNRMWSLTVAERNTAACLPFSLFFLSCCCFTISSRLRPPFPIIRRSARSKKNMRASNMLSDFGLPEIVCVVFMYFYVVQQTGSYSIAYSKLAKVLKGKLLKLFASDHVQTGPWSGLLCIKSSPNFLWVKS